MAIRPPSGGPIKRLTIRVSRARRRQAAWTTPLLIVAIVTGFPMPPGGLAGLAVGVVVAAGVARAVWAVLLSQRIVLTPDRIGRAGLLRPLRMRPRSDVASVVIAEVSNGRRDYDFRRYVVLRNSDGRRLFALRQPPFAEADLDLLVELLGKPVHDTGEPLSWREIEFRHPGALPLGERHRFARILVILAIATAVIAAVYAIAIALFA